MHAANHKKRKNKVKLRLAQTVKFIFFLQEKVQTGAVLVLFVVAHRLLWETKSHKQTLRTKDGVKPKNPNILVKLGFSQTLRFE